MVALVSTLFLDCHAGLSFIDKYTTEKGIDAGEEIVDAIESKKFPETLQTVKKNIEPFLEALRPFVSLTLSPEDQTSKQLNPRMEVIVTRLYKEKENNDARIADIKTGIHWRQFYGSLEHFINQLTIRFYNFIAYFKNEPADIRKTKGYTEIYEGMYFDSGEKFYNLVVSGNKSESIKPLATAVTELPNVDRKHARGLFTYVTKLFVQAALVEVSYYATKDRRVTARYTAAIWKNRISKATDTFQEADAQLDK